MKYVMIRKLTAHASMEYVMSKKYDACRLRKSFQTSATVKSSQNKDDLEFKKDNIIQRF